MQAVEEVSGPPASLQARAYDPDKPYLRRIEITNRDGGGYSVRFLEVHPCGAVVGKNYGIEQSPSPAAAVAIALMLHAAYESRI